jgi:hypothetical protein
MMQTPSSVGSGGRSAAAAAAGGSRCNNSRSESVEIWRKYGSVSSVKGGSAVAGDGDDDGHEVVHARRGDLHDVARPQHGRVGLGAGGARG